MKRTGSGDEIAGGARCEINPAVFRRRLMAWYRENARALPWRETYVPYRIWVAEIMLQQTRVAAVVGALQRVHAALSHAGLAGAGQRAGGAGGVVAGWATTTARGCCTRRRSSSWASARDGCRRRRRSCARCLGSASTRRRRSPALAFGEGVAVVDGNVERVVLRLTGRASENTAAARGFVRAQAQALLPQGRGTASRRDGQSGGGAGTPHSDNPVGDHNQAMMELGATVCLPRAPLLQRVSGARALPYARGAFDAARARRSAASPPPACWTCASAGRPPRSCCNAGPRTPV